MTEHARPDDRRRFDDLGKEMVIARMLAPLLTVLFLAIIGGLAKETRSGLVALVFSLGCIAAPAIPSVAAKRGLIVLPAVCGAVVAAMLATRTGIEQAAPVSSVMESRAIFGVIGATVGLIEGMLERSIATIYCGLIGGGFVGAVVGAAFSLAENMGNNMLLLTFIVIGFVTIEEGIAFSLAIGRRIRDLPKRTQPGAPPAGGTDAGQG